METNNRVLFSKCFNQMVANNNRAAEASFTEAYLNNPGDIRFLYGIISSMILQKKVFKNFLEKEKLVSAHKEKIINILLFLRSNPSFTSLPVHSQLYNLGLFLRKSFDDKQAGLFLQAADITKPSNIKNLTARGELATANRDYGMGLSLYSKAAELFLQKSNNPDG